MISIFSSSVLGLPQGLVSSRVARELIGFDARDSSASSLPSYLWPPGPTYDLARTLLPLDLWWDYFIPQGALAHH